MANQKRWEGEIMKVFLYLVFLILIGIAPSYSQEGGEFRSVAAAFETQSTSQFPQEGSFERLIKAWSEVSEDRKSAEWPTLALAYIRQSENALAHSDGKQASDSLRAAGLLAKQFDGNLEYLTKSPILFFSRLARLQTRIAAITGDDPLKGLVNYLFRKDGESYIVARQEREPEVNGILVEGLSENEAVLLVHQFTTKDRLILGEKTRWIIGPEGLVDSTFDQSTKEILLDPTGQMKIGLSVNGNKPHDIERKPSTSLNNSHPPGAAQQPFITWAAWVLLCLATSLIIWRCSKKSVSR